MPDFSNRNYTTAAGPETKGGGFRGGPKRWTGRGPPPARHIPWPEIFKHHISVVEGHLKMIDMVRKHTAEGTGNFRTIMGHLDRTKEMLSVAKRLQYSFVPPPNQRDQVPLGSSSASMYPGYSPADHEYGKAAEEYGSAVAEAKARGVEIPKHPDIDYQIGQGKGVKRKALAQSRETSGAKEQSEGGTGSGKGSASEAPTKKRKTNGHIMLENGTDTAAANVPSEGDNPFFVIDTKPTPVSLPGHALRTSPTKREIDADATEGKKSKKPKQKHSGDPPPPPAETEDISAEVDARLKEKEEKRRRKEEKKRKRESEKSVEAVPEATGDIAPTTQVIEKPKKKKKKVKGSEEDGGAELPDRSIPTTRDADKSDTVKEGNEGKKKREEQGV